MHDAEAITEEELRDHLFECADIIRDRVDPTEYKTYILPLIFYKALDDTWRDRYEEALENNNGDEEVAKKIAETYYKMPEGRRFVDAKEKADGVDKFLDETFRKIERINPDRINNVFKVEYTNAESLDHDTLHEVLQHLNTRSLSLKRVPPDILGEAYMDLVADFAENEGKEGGQFFTPRGIVKLMSSILDPHGPSNVLDPTVGSAGMLVQMAEHYKEKDYGDPKQDLTLKGQEINPGIAPIARMNLFLHDLDGEIAREDSLGKPAFTEGDRLEKFDYVIANPPFSANWQKDDAPDYNRWTWGMARADRADYAFIQHMTHSLNEKGRMACVIPHGVLFRKYEKKFRKGMLEGEGEEFDGNIVEAIIGLPENLFQNNSIPSGVLVINRDKPEEKKDEVLFVHAGDNKNGHEFYQELSNQNELTEEGIDHIVDNFRDWKAEEQVSRAVPLQEIRENDYNLNIALYIDTTEPEEDIDVSEELQKLHDLEEEYQGIRETMEKHMEALDYE